MTGTPRSFTPGVMCIFTREPSSQLSQTWILLFRGNADQETLLQEASGDVLQRPKVLPARTLMRVRSDRGGSGLRRVTPRFTHKQGRRLPFRASSPAFAPSDTPCHILKHFGIHHIP